MKITKEEALALSKVLHPFIDYNSREDDKKTDYQLLLEDLQERLTDFLVYDGDEEGVEDDEEAEDDVDEEEDPSDEEDEKEVEERSDEESDLEDDEPEVD